MNLIDFAETGFLPDSLVRFGIRRLLANRKSFQSDSLHEFADTLRNSPLAVETDAANQQHYEVPAEFFEHVLGPRLKYSACDFRSEDASLADAEDAMLRRTCERAELENGMSVLELGCGWGSLTLWMAEHFPACTISALSNSASQRQFIEECARIRGLTNVQLITEDMRNFDPHNTFDRVISVEMLEHMRNYELLLARVSRWLEVNGKLFVHIFCHRDTPYIFGTEGAANWMGRNFFTGGMMPSEQLFGCFSDDLTIEKQWRVNGMHYWRTCEAWLANLDRNRNAILGRFEEDLSARESRRSLQKWRIFLMACAELFRHQDGNEWFVSHYLFHPSSVAPEVNSTIVAEV